MAFFYGIGDDATHQAAGPDGIVVAGDHVLDDVGITVGVDHRHDGDTQLVRLGHPDGFFLGVDHEHRVWQFLHVADTGQVPLQLLQLTPDEEGFLLGHHGELSGVAHALVFLHLANPLEHGLVVSQHAAQPTLVDVGHAALLGVGTHRVLGLLLGADEQHRSPVGHQVTDGVVGDLDPFQGLLQVDDVDTAALTPDETLHLGVPAPGLVPEVDTGIEQLLHGYDGHGKLLRLRSAAACARGATEVGEGRKLVDKPVEA